MSIDILISTIDEGIHNIPNVLLPPAENVGYVVSMQYTDEKYLTYIPAELISRGDVRLLTLSGRGLSRNRNHALDASEADIVVIADDDERLYPNALERIRQCYSQHPSTDIALFRLDDTEGHPFKPYHFDAPVSYAEARKEGYYPSSLEITMRRSAFCSGLRFNECFGLGSGGFSCGEEEVLLHDAEHKDLKITLFPVTIGSTFAVSTGKRFLTDTGVQRAKGAVFAYCFGRLQALWRITKEALYHLVHHGTNPLPLFVHMWQGVWSSPSK